MRDTPGARSVSAAASARLMDEEVPAVAAQHGARAESNLAQRDGSTAQEPVAGPSQVRLTADTPWPTKQSRCSSNLPASRLRVSSSGAAWPVTTSLLCQSMPHRLSPVSSVTLRPPLTQVWGELLEREGPPEPEFAPPGEAGQAHPSQQAAPGPGLLQGALATLAQAPDGVDPMALPSDRQGQGLEEAQQPTPAYEPAAAADAPLAGDGADLRDGEAPGAPTQAQAVQATALSQLGMPDKMEEQAQGAAAASATAGLPSPTRMVTRTMSRKRRSGLDAQGPDA